MIYTLYTIIIEWPSGFLERPPSVLLLAAVSFVRNVTTLFCSIYSVQGREKEGRRNGHLTAFRAEPLITNNVRRNNF